MATGGNDDMDKQVVLASPPVLRVLGITFTEPAMKRDATEHRGLNRRESRGRSSKPNSGRQRSQSVGPSGLSSVVQSVFKRGGRRAMNMISSHRNDTDAQVPALEGQQQRTTPNPRGRSESFSHPSESRSWAKDPVPGSVIRVPPRPVGENAVQIDQDSRDIVPAEAVVTYLPQNPVVDRSEPMHGNSLEQVGAQNGAPKLAPVDVSRFELQLDAAKSLSELQLQVEEQDREIQLLREELQKKEKSLRALQKTTAEAASRAADIPPALVLFRPEKQLVDDWNALGYDIRNFVRNYLRGASGRDRANWAMSNKIQLSEITPNHQNFATDSKLSWVLIEASIWATLSRFVFGVSNNEGPICWGGQYATPLSKLSTAVTKKLHSTDEQALRLYHHWKALSTNIVAMAGSQDGRETGLSEPASKLLGLLQDLLPKAKDRLSRDALWGIVQSAVKLDELFCGQMTWYKVYYSKPRHGMEFDSGRMEALSEKVSIRTVRFVVQPALCRAGGTGGERYAESSMVVRQLVV